MLHQVIYASAAVGPQTETLLADILEQARKNNTRDQLTGMLMTANQCYFQVLEGNEDKIDACLDRLRLDRRHTSMLITARRKIDTRMFPGWSMGCEKLSALGKRMSGAFDIRQIGENIDLQGLAQHTPELLALMRAFFVISGQELPNFRRAV